MKASDQQGRIDRLYARNIRAVGGPTLESRGSYEGNLLAIHPPEKDIDDLIEIDFQRKALGLDVPVDKSPLLQPTLDTKGTNDDFVRSEARNYLRILGKPRASSDLAQDILHRLSKGVPLPEPGQSATEIAEYMTALLRIVAALQGTDDDFVEWMSPLDFETPNIDSLARKLQEAGNDAAKMKSILVAFRGMPENANAIAQKFGTIRFDSKLLKRELRDAQCLPKLDNPSKKTIKEAVEDEIKELLLRHGSHLHALRNLLDKAGENTILEVADTYDELIHAEDKGFSATVERLLARHNVSTLLNTVIPLFEKTLSHELNLKDALRSVDKEKLRSILSEIQNLHILKSLAERMDLFLSMLERVHGICSINSKQLNTKNLIISVLRAASARWLPSSHFVQITKDFGIPDGEASIYFLTGLMQFFREIPTKVFEELSVRAALLESIQGALDGIIEREEISSISENKVVENT